MDLRIKIEYGLIFENLLMLNKGVCMEQERITVIIPMNNVEKHTFKVIQEIPEQVEYIVAVDNCSKDNTVSIVQTINDSRILILQHEKNRGVGGAMITGFKKAIEIGATIAIKNDGDGFQDTNGVFKSSHSTNFER